MGLVGRLGIVVGEGRCGDGFFTFGQCLPSLAWLPDIHGTAPSTF